MLAGSARTLLAVEVIAQERLDAGETGQQSLADAMGVAYRAVPGHDVAATLVDVAHTENATHLLIGRPTRRLRWNRPDLSSQLLDLDPGIVVMLASTRPADHRRPGRRRIGLKRRCAGCALSVGLPVLATLVGLAWPDEAVGLSGITLLHLLAVVAAASVGGVVPGVLAALVGGGLVNFFFVPPTGTVFIDAPKHVVNLAVFLLVSTLISLIVERAARKARAAAHATATSLRLASLAQTPLHASDALPRLLEQVRLAFGAESASVLKYSEAHGTGVVVDADGVGHPESPDEAEVSVELEPSLRLCLTGRRLGPAERTVLEAFAAQVRNAIDRDGLQTSLTGLVQDRPTSRPERQRAVA